MNFEARIDYIEGIGNRYLTSEGHIVELSKAVENELNNIGISAKLFVEGLVDFISQDNTNSYSFFIPAKPIKDHCNNIVKIFEILVSTRLSSINILTVIINIEGSAQIVLLKPELYNNISKELIQILTEKYFCLEITMPFIYRFVIFDTFNVFKKLFRITFEGIVNLSGTKYMTSISDDMKALIWQIDSTNIHYLRNNLIPSELLRLAR